MEFYLVQPAKTGKNGEFLLDWMTASCHHCHALPMIIIINNYERQSMKIIFARDDDDDEVCECLCVLALITTSFHVIIYNYCY